MNRPNFLLVSADQQRGDCLGVEGRRIKTPHLDRLAAEGTRFTAAITPNCVCQPARASILTGLLPLTHGVHDNGIDLDPATGEKGFSGALAAAGYDTAFFGKGHFSTYHTFEWELLPARTGVALSLRTVRTKTHKLTVDRRNGAGELYDLESNPGEVRNLS